MRCLKNRQLDLWCSGMFGRLGKTENNCEKCNGFVKLAKVNKINGLEHGEGRVFVIKVAIVRK